MSLPAYEDIAFLLEAEFVPHHRVTRSGIRKYLMRIAVERPLSPPSAPGWYRLWKEIEWVRGMAQALRVELPAKLWDEDRARLAAKLAQPTYYPDPGYAHADKEQARRWTQRRSQTS